jgi:hypothetical protein
MTPDEERNKLAVDAALAFMAAEPAFIAIPENSKVIVEYLENHPELQPTEIVSYQQAFRACRDRLRFEHQMSAEEFKQAVVIPACQKRQHDKPKPSEIDVMLKELFESHGFRDSVKNRAAVNQYMRDHDVEDFSLSNLAKAVEALGDCLALELSDAAIEQMPSHIYKKVVEQEFLGRQQKQPQPQPSERPFGVRSWSEWIHSK